MRASLQKIATPQEQKYRIGRKGQRRELARNNNSRGLERENTNIWNMKVKAKHRERCTSGEWHTERSASGPRGVGGSGRRVRARLERREPVDEAPDDADELQVLERRHHKERVAVVPHGQPVRVLSARVAARVAARARGVRLLQVGALHRTVRCNTVI